MAAETEVVLVAARQALEIWTQLQIAREQALARDRPAAVGRFFQPVLAAHSNLFNACWIATRWKRSEEENRVVVALRRYALSILSRAEYAGELWLDGEDHRRWVHAHVERLSGQQAHHTDWARKAQSILDSGATLDTVERATVSACLTARAIAPGVQALLDAIGARCIPDSPVAEQAAPASRAPVLGPPAPILGAPISEPADDAAAKTSPVDSESPTKMDRLRETTAALAELDPAADGSPELEKITEARAKLAEFRHAQLEADLADRREPADEPARRRG